VKPGTSLPYIPLSSSLPGPLCQTGADSSPRSDYMQHHDIKVTFLGRREMLPPDVLDAVESMERETATHQTYASFPFLFLERTSSLTVLCVARC
jgi:hypothetical protein